MKTASKSDVQIAPDSLAKVNFPELNFDAVKVVGFRRTASLGTEIFSVTHHGNNFLYFEIYMKLMNEVGSAAYRSNRIDTENLNMKSKSCFDKNVTKKIKINEKVIFKQE